MNNYQRMVREFIVAMKQPTPERPSLVDFRSQLRVALIREEAGEFAEACGFTDDGGEEWVETEDRDWPEMIDAICDLLYVTYGAANEMGIDLDPFFHEVHQTNMEKIGGPVRESDGKLLKPPGWTPPDIQGILEAILEEPKRLLVRPTMVVEGVDVPTLVFTVAGAEKAIGVRSWSFSEDIEAGAYPDGLWLIPHPDLV